MPRKIYGSTDSKGKTIDFDSISDKEYNKRTGKYIVRIRTQSESASFKDVMKIVERYPNWVEDKLRFVVFEEANIDLYNLIDLTRRWKVFRLIIDGNEYEREEVDRIVETLYCEYKDQCNGICMHYKSYYFFNNKRLDEIIELMNQSEFSWDIMRLLERENWAKQNKDEENEYYLIDKEDCKREIKDYLRFEEEFCPIYDPKKIDEILEDVPEKITNTRRITFIQNEQLTEEEIEARNKERKTIFLTEEQMDIIAKKISEEMEIILKKLLKEIKK